MKNLGLLGIVLFLASCVANSPSDVDLEATAIGPVQVGAGFVDPIYLTPLGATLYFQASNPATGRELWKSDGTNAGTVLVKDIVPGPTNANPVGFTEVNGTVIFGVYKQGSVNSVELWKTDGSATGTVLVKVINPNDSLGLSISHPINVNGTAYFTADDGVRGQELWKSDGTTAGTRIVKDINPGAAHSLITGLVNANGTLYFGAVKAGFGRELWKSDGSAAGTRMVRNINRNGDALAYGGSITTIDDTVFFGADNGIYGYELWKSDGTAAGTVLVKDVSPEADSSYAEGFIVLDNTLLFSAYDKPLPAKRKLWTSDGTTAGTVLLKDLDLSKTFYNHFILNGTVYFGAFNSTYGSELWKSDGTTAGTVLVKDIYSGSKSSNPGGLNFVLTGLNNTLYFSARDATHGYELWKSNGTETGTKLVKDMNLGPDGSNFNGLTNLNGTLFFRLKQSGIPGYTLWKYEP